MICSSDLTQAQIHDKSLNEPSKMTYEDATSVNFTIDYREDVMSSVDCTPCEPYDMGTDEVRNRDMPSTVVEEKEEEFYMSVKNV